MAQEEHETTKQYLQQVSKELELQLEHVYQLETSVDDVTGETLGNFMEMLLERELALDVNYIPITMKHSRPGVLVRVLTTKNNLKPVIYLLMTELGTFGVRIEPVIRVVAKRDHVTETIMLNNREVRIRIKRSWTTDGMLLHWKPENKDVVAAARALNVPTRIIMQALQQKIKPKSWTRENENDE